MEPLTLISGALSLADAVGLDEWFGELVGGKPGAQAAAKVVDIAKSVTGTGSIEDALAHIKDNQAFAHDFKMKVLNNEHELKLAVYADRKSARDMQVAALNQNDLFSKRFIYYFAIFWSAFAMIYLTGITFFELPEESVRYADTTLGFLLGTIVAGIIAFFYGDSANSQRKDELNAIKPSN